MKILILGGAGMIGQAIAKRHIEAGDEVDIFDTFSNPYTPQLPRYGNLLADFSVSRYDLISNQASLVGVGESMYLPYKYLSNNIQEVGHLIQMVLDSKKQIPIIHAGSMGPYGEGPHRCYSCGAEFHQTSIRKSIYVRCPLCGGEYTDGIPIREDSEKNPQSFYAITKLAQEESLRVFAQAYGNPVVSLRYFSVYSTDQNPVNPRTGVLSIIGNQLLNCKDIVINEDGEQTRDLIHVNDIAEAHFLASRSGFRHYFSYYNVGTGMSYSMLCVAEHMRNAMLSPAAITVNNELRLGDIRDSCASTYKASTELGFNAKVKLMDSIDKYCAFLLEHKKEFLSNSWKEEQKRIKERGLQ